MRFVGLVAALLLVTTRAFADDAPTSQQLFDEGNALAAAGRYAEACPKLEESLRLEPAVGTQFNLADCDEHLGLVATAHALYIDVIRIAHSAGKFQREEAAKTRAEAIAPRVPHVRLKLANADSVREIRIDTKELTRDQFTADIALDPGKHALYVTGAPGMAATETFLLKEGQLREIAVADLAPPPPPPPIVEPPPVVAPPQRSLARSIGTPVAEGIALAGIITGSIAGGIAISKKSDADDLCPEATYHFHCPTKAGSEAWSSAGSAGNVSTVAFIVGGVALATAIVLWVTAPPRSKPATARAAAFAF